MIDTEHAPQLNGSRPMEEAVIPPDEQAVLPAPTREVSLPAVEETADVDFDAWRALTRLVVGGALEGSSELTRRLAVWEAFLREEASGEEASASSDIPASEDNQALLRHALIGLVFESGDQARRGLSLAWRFQKTVAKTAVRSTHPLTQSRLMRPLQQRLDRAAQRGQDELVRWIQRGQAEEPVSRQLADLAYAEIVAEFIGQLAGNQEVQELVQQQGVSLAGEVVDQVRERTFTADTVVERLARALTRRPTRLTPPPADLSELPGGPLA
jgi:hypothetical protein